MFFFNIEYISTDQPTQCSVPTGRLIWGGDTPPCDVTKGLMSKRLIVAHQHDALVHRGSADEELGSVPQLTSSLTLKAFLRSTAGRSGRRKCV